MNSYESLIDRTNFGIVADYLRNPKSPIELILHVKDRSMLSTLAGSLDRAIQSGSNPAQAASVLINGFINEGVLLVSARHALALSDARPLVNETSIPRLASCDVIYAPPFYLAHTPGLFEGTLIGKTTAPRQNIAGERPVGMRFKP